MPATAKIDININNATPAPGLRTKAKELTTKTYATIITTAAILFIVLKPAVKLPKKPSIKGKENKKKPRKLYTNMLSKRTEKILAIIKILPLSPTRMFNILSITEVKGYAKNIPSANASLTKPPFGFMFQFYHEKTIPNSTQP